jgi:hypothetical protein
MGALKALRIATFFWIATASLGTVAACSSVDVQPYNSIPESAPSSYFTLIVQGVGFSEYEGVGITVRFPDVGEERDAVIVAGRFSVEYGVVISPDMLPEWVRIEYLLHGPLRELCEGDALPVLRAEAPLVSHDGFGTVVVNHPEVPQEPVACEPWDGL